MLIVMKTDCTSEEVDHVLQLARSSGWQASLLRVCDRPAISLSVQTGPADPGAFEALPGVEQVVPFDGPTMQVHRGSRAGPTTVRVGATRIGDGGLTLIAGPCAVESEEQLIPLAMSLKAAGADLLRGGAYKPRSSPYDFQGLGEHGLRLLARARVASGLPVVSEAVDEASLELVEGYADVVQVGARNMQNFGLLKRVGRCRLPVFLKRGLAAEMGDLLLAAEYLLDAGNPNVILCERGIRTFSTHSRFTLDLSIVPKLKRLSHLPVFVDPSHASGARESVPPLARAAVAVGADGVMLEVHPDPLHALCDGPQSLTPAEFASLASELRGLAPLIARLRETVS